MYQFDLRPLTWKLYVYDSAKGESAAGRTNYTTSMLITDLGLKECRVHFVHGKLGKEINLGIYNTMKALDYVQGQLEVPAGTPATGLGVYSHTCDGLDRYIVKVK